MRWARVGERRLGVDVEDLDEDEDEDDGNWGAVRGDRIIRGSEGGSFGWTCEAGMREGNRKCVARGIGTYS